MRLVLCAVLVGTACTGSERPVEEPRAVAGSRGVEVLISTSDALIGGVSDVVLGVNGTVYAVDRQASQIHIVEGGGQVKSLGRAGAGPGEFSQPTTLLERGDTLLVVDWGNGRLQGISVSGEALFTRPLPPGYPPSLAPDGRFVRPTLGADSALAVIHRPDLSVVVSIGEIVGVPTNRIHVGRMKREIQEGTVPSIFLNTAESVVGQDGATWLYVPARGSVQRFDAEGREVFSLALDEPEHNDLLQRFVEANAAKPANSFAALEYIADATVVGLDLWVLLGSSLEGSAAVRIIHPDGRVGERTEFAEVIGASQMAIDLERGHGYFVLEDLAELVRVGLNGGSALPMR